MILSLVFLFAPAAATVAVPLPAADMTPFVEEAARQTGIPAAVIWAVIGVESRGQIRAVSPKGAMGLMQLMPGTWSMLHRRLGLGPDVFNPRDNILAGTWYLRDLYDRYGWDGAFAAYNAGPGRWEAYRDRRLPLPSETQTYVTKIAASLDGKGMSVAPPATGPRPSPWTEAGLFVADGDRSDHASPTFVAPSAPFVDLTLPVPVAPE